MNATITALIIAIVGVTGTLLAPIVSQRLSAHARREEFELQRSQRQDEYNREQQEKVLTAKRNCYISIISAARRYRFELLRYLYAATHGTVNDATRDSLEEARLVFITNLAETELTAAVPVIKALEPFRKGMSESYVATKELEQGAQELNKSFEEIRTFVVKLGDAMSPVHAAMRDDLGVKD